MNQEELLQAMEKLREQSAQDHIQKNHGAVCPDHDMDKQLHLEPSDPHYQITVCSVCIAEELEAMDK